MSEPDIVVEIVKAVAAADGVDPSELDVLYKWINPEVLYTLYERDRGRWSFTFQFSDHQVTVTHDSRIIVDGVGFTSDVPSSHGK